VVGTINWGLHYHPGKKNGSAPELQGYSDSDLTGDVNNRKSTRQKVVALTTTATVIFGGQKPPKISHLPPEISYFRRQKVYFRAA
jgi:hypothetical protein